MSIRCPHALCASGGLGWCSERLLLLLLLLLLSACLLEVATVGPGGTSRKVPCECNNCPQLPTLNLTEAPAALNCCTNGGRFRYKCVVNHVRKAGTSNLAACTSENGIGTWSKPNLVCIPDPRIVITTKPPDVNPTSHAPPQSVTSTNQMAPESSANRGIHQPIPPTSTATMLTHADAVLTTSPAPTTSPITTSPIPIPTTTTTSTPTTSSITSTTTTATPTTATSTTTTPTPTTTTTTSTPTTSSTTSTTTTPTPTTATSTTTSTPTTTTSTPTATSPSPAAVPRPDEGTPGAQGVPSSGAAVPTGLGLAALILISAILGFSFCCWRRKRSANCPTGSAEPTPPEEMPLNPTNPPPPSGSAPPGPPS
ncbi:unnamed protein product [Gadus morhua 'NCC']